MNLVFLFFRCKYNWVWLVFVCFLIMGKVRVVFLKMVIILRLEFIVVVVLVKVGKMFC